MQPSKNGPKLGENGRKGFWMALLSLIIVLGLLFFRSFMPGIVHFANDGPLGAINAAWMSPWQNFRGIWMDLYWIGTYGGNLPLDLNSLILLALGPVGDAKFLQPLSLLFLGICAWIFFRQLKLSPVLGTVATLAATLNMNYFSNVCWGLGTRALTLGWIFLALAALMNPSARLRWVRLILGGLAVGMALIEGADNGVILSIYVGSFALFLTIIDDKPAQISWNKSKVTGAIALLALIVAVLAWVASTQSKHALILMGLAGVSLFVAGFAGVLTLTGDCPGIKTLFKGAGRASILVIFAGLIATQTIISLVQTQVKGIAGMKQEVAKEDRAKEDEKTRLEREQREKAEEEMRWTWATQWSLCKTETLRVIIPGLFGYRMDDSSGGAYWGRVGQAPGNDKSRFSGAGEYAGVLVVLLALWAIAESLRRNSAFAPKERKIIWFWGVAAVVSVLLSWGRFAPFYQVLYAMPYFSAVRNPMKFMHPFHMILMILFAYGLLGISRRYLEMAAARPVALFEQLKLWWAKASSFEKRWTIGSFAAIGLSIIGFLVYNSSRKALEQHLDNCGFGGLASLMASFSINDVGVFVLYLALSVALLTVIMSGTFAGRRARWAGALLGLLLVVDLARANEYWIKFYNYPDKYASNPVLDMLRDKPYEHRVVLLGSQEVQVLQQLYQLLGGDWLQTYLPLREVYTIEWTQHHFPYYNIQCLDVTQESRLPEDKLAYKSALGTNIPRLWELTNTRYVLGTPDKFIGLLNNLDRMKNRFTVLQRFKIDNKMGPDQYSPMEHTETPAADGPCALIEFTGALPRAKLYTQWQVLTNDQEVLKQLGNPDWDPAQSVLLSGGSIPAPAAAPASQGGSVEFASYTPKRLELRSKADTATVLLLNDKYDPGWKVSVDGNPAQILRANYIMRGVYLPAGSHTIEFRFEPVIKGFAVTLSALSLGVLLCGVLAGARFIPPRQQPAATPAVPASQPGK